MTVEAAIAIASLLVVVLLSLGAALAASVQIRCTDAAREAARLSARGDDAAANEAARQVGPPGARVTITVDGDRVRATVRAPAGLLPLELRGEAVAAREPES